MYSTHETNATFSLTALHPIVHAATLAASLGALGSLGLFEAEAQATPPNCSTSFDPSASYPGLPQSAGADIVGESFVSLFLQDQRGVALINGCFYEIDRPLEIAFGELDSIDLDFEVYANADLALVSDAGQTVEIVDVGAYGFVYSLMADDPELGFEPADPGQSAPTSPVVVVKPIEDDPPPN